MTRFLLLPLLLLPLVLAQAVPRASAAPNSPQIVAPGGIVIDGWSGAVLWEKNADIPRYPASTVKIMTAWLVLRSKIPMTRVVTVGYDAIAVGGSSAGLYMGERLTVWELLHALLLPSGNDAAFALADAVGGSSAHFVEMMNAEARRLHLWHTHYMSPNGFDMQLQLTSVRDLATLARFAMHRKRFSEVAGARSWSTWSVDHQFWHQWTNLNKLLWQYKAVDGVKTGTTPLAGACLVSSARQNGRWVIAVNMGSTEDSRFHDGAELLNFGLAVDAGAPSTR